jgi:hypothetical protein
VARKFADVKAAHKPLEASVAVCLDGELLSRIAEVEARIPAEERDDDRENRTPVAPALKREADELREQAESDAVTFRFRSVGSKAWSDLLAQHPPSKEQRRETGVDYNPDTFPQAAIQASCADPTLDDEDAAWLVEHLSLGQFRRLWTACLEANVGPGDLPKARRTAAPPATASSSTTAPPEASPALSS